MLSDVPDTDEFDLDSIIAEVSGQAPAKAAEPKITAEPEAGRAAACTDGRDQGRGAKDGSQK
ncbi:MAG: hypothetical protein ACLSGI_05955 [Butyricicoccaceae bacterium]